MEPLAHSARQVHHTAHQRGVELLLADSHLPADVRACLDDAQTAGSQCGAGWHALLAEHVFQPGDGASWLVLREDGCCKALWPVQWGPTPGALSNFYTVLYRPWHAPDVSPEGLTELASAFRARCAGRPRSIFGPMDPTIPEFEAMERALCRAGLVTFRYFRFGNWYLPCAGLPRSEYVASRQSTLRNNIRRLGKRLARDGGSLELITGGSRLEAGTTAYSQVYASSWKRPEPYPEFIPALIHDCARRGTLRLGIAWLGDKAIGAQLWIVGNGRAEAVKAAYHDAFKNYSIGLLLTAMLIEQALDVDTVSEIDFTVGDESYKRYWMSHRRERWGIAAYDPRTAAGLFGIAWNGARRMLKG